MQGLSTRSVDELVKALGMSGVSRSEVRRLCGELDERVGAFLDRPRLLGRAPRLQEVGKVSCRGAASGS